jgi:hypothetical protein
MYYIFSYPANLKEYFFFEVQTLFPHWKLSFSQKGLVSFKSENVPLDEKKFLQFPLFYFCWTGGEFLEKSSQIPPHDQDYFTISSNKKNNEYWLYKKRTINHLNFSNGFCDKNVPFYSLGPQIYSRAYFKLQEFSNYIFNLKHVSSNLASVIEIASAPGGMTGYLLQNNFDVWAIDSAQMDKRLESDFREQIERGFYRHINKSIFDIHQHDLPTQAKLICCDLNLSPEVSLKECLRLALFYQTPPSIYINLKLPQASSFLITLKLINKILKEKNFEYKIFKLFHLPAHQKEIGLWLSL